MFFCQFLGFFGVFGERLQSFLRLIRLLIYEQRRRIRIYVSQQIESRVSIL